MRSTLFIFQNSSGCHSGGPEVRRTAGEEEAAAGEPAEDVRAAAAGQLHFLRRLGDVVGRVHGRGDDGHRDGDHVVVLLRRRRRGRRRRSWTREEAQLEAKGRSK